MPPFTMEIVDHAPGMFENVVVDLGFHLWFVFSSPARICNCSHPRSSGTEIAQAVERDFVTVELEAVGNHPVQVSGAALHIKHPIAGLAVEVMMMHVRNRGRFISISLSCHGHRGDHVIIEQSLDDSINGSDADAGRCVGGDVCDFIDGQRATGIFDRGPDRSLL